MCTLGQMPVIYGSASCPREPLGTIMIVEVKTIGTEIMMEINPKGLAKAIGKVL